MERKHFQLIETDLPDKKGTYVLIASLSQMKRIEIGQLGAFDLYAPQHSPQQGFGLLAFGSILHDYVPEV